MTSSSDLELADRSVGFRNPVKADGSLRTTWSATRPCLVTGALLPWTGGPVRSIGAFQRALDASVVSFVERHDLPHHALPLAESHLQLVSCTRAPGFRHLLLPDRKSLHAAQRLIDAADMVSCHSFYTSHPAWMYDICRRQGLPYWIVPHGILDPYVANRNRLVKRLYMTAVGRACLANATATVFSTKNERDKAMRTARVANPVVINWPVDIPPEHDRAPARASLRSRLGLPPDASLLLYLGRLHPMKRPIETIQCFSGATDRSWHMLLVGHSDGVSEQECRNAAQACGVADRVHVVPGVPAAEVARVIQACDLFVSYSFRENFNNAAAECLAAGLPILLSLGNDLLAEVDGLSAVGSLPEPPTEAMAAIRRWTSMPDSERADRGREGRAWAATNLSFDQFRERLQSLRRDTVATSG